MTETPSILRWSGMTHRGHVRRNNEDAFLALTFDASGLRYLGKIGESDMNGAARDHSDEVAKRIPEKRIGTDEDMAGVAIYLASRAGDYVVGNTIAVDGGVVYANAGLEIAG